MLIYIQYGKKISMSIVIFLVKTETAEENAMCCIEIVGKMLCVV